MTEPIKIRAHLKEGIAEIRVQMMHPMESGLGKPESGRKNQPAPHFIESFTVTVNGKLIADGQTGFSISRNPVFTFKLRGANAGDKIVVEWTDNKGDKRTDESLIN